ncbi:unnamed protein product [Microthlaspi erraticum]|uniref:non-specific serine/threonine protein kinase n=1 Tax=Microthlaspi erraticum TaxID=1685480 RepID=A0A6D2L5G4_9BRAS|nr:unnamed protein product [Microthlaspi erraticum]
MGVVRSWSVDLHSFGLHTSTTQIGSGRFTDEDIFELSPTYKSVTVFYDCNPFRLHFTSFIVNVPTSFVTNEKELNMIDLERVLRNGFEVKMKIDENEICGFNEILPFGVTCGPLHPPPTPTDLNQIMYNLPTSCLVFLLLFSLFHHLSSASSKQEHGWCETLFQCGNVTVGFPFSGGNRPQFCGHPLLQLHCFKDQTSIIISNHLYLVLDIDQASNTLRLSRAELIGSFCLATFTATTLPPEIFELSPNYKNLTVFYVCDPMLHYHSSYKCPGRGPVSMSENHDYHSSCDDSFMINVPKSFVPEEKELNRSKLESVLSKGFEVIVKIDKKACQECSSSHGICGFENTTQVCCNESSSSECKKLTYIRI